MRQAGKIALVLGVLGMVALGGVARAEVKVAKRGSGGSAATSSKVSWLGFRPTSGGRSEVFLLLTQAVTPREAVVGDRLYLMFDGVGVGRHGQQRALDTRFFETPISYVKLTTVGHGGCRDCGSLGKHLKKKLKKGETVAAAPPGPNMTGAGVVITILFKSGAATTHDVGSEDSTYDPEPPPHSRDGTPLPEAKPLEAVHRTLVRVGFPPYANSTTEVDLPTGGHRGRVISPEPQAPTDASGRILVTEPKPKTIAIPPAPKK